MKKKSQFEYVKPPFKASAERDRLIERMLKMEISELLPYGDIAGIIGESAQTQRGYSIIRSAKKLLRNEHHRVFVNIANNGIKRLNDDEIVDHVTSVVVSVRRKVKVGSRELECVSYAELPVEKRTDYHLNRTLMHYVTAMVNNESIRNSRALIASQSEAVEAGNVLSLFQIIEPKKQAG
jgi:hypothetical protein